LYQSDGQAVGKYHLGIAMVITDLVFRFVPVNTISTMTVAIICSHSHLYHWSAEVAVAVAAEAVALPTEALRWFEANCSSTTT